LIELPFFSLGATMNARTRLRGCSRCWTMTGKQEG
jgi:hypothetical protein